MQRPTSPTEKGYKYSPMKIGPDAFAHNAMLNKYASWLAQVENLINEKYPGVDVMRLPVGWRAIYSWGYPPATAVQYAETRLTFAEIHPNIADDFSYAMDKIMAMFPRPEEYKHSDKATQAIQRILDGYEINDPVGLAVRWVNLWLLSNDAKRVMDMLGTHSPEGLAREMTRYAKSQLVIGSGLGRVIMAQALLPNAFYVLYFLGYFQD